MRGIGWAVVASASVAFTASTPIALLHGAIRSGPMTASDSLILATSWFVGITLLLAICLIEDVAGAFSRAREHGRNEELDQMIAMYRRLAAHACIPCLAFRMTPRVVAAAARRVPMHRFRRARSE